MRTFDRLFPAAARAGAITFALLACSIALSMAAGRSAGLSGSVTDQNGTAIASAEVVVAELGRETTTGEDGRFSLPDLPLGDYTIVVRHAGYAAAVRDVLLHADASLSVRLEATPFPVDPILVTTTRGPSQAVRSPLPSTVLSGTQVRREHGVSLAHVVEQVPGVRTLSTGEEIGKPVVRGLSGPRVLVLDNGHHMEDYSWSEEDGPSIDPETAERIEVIRGPASVLYGSDAIGGVINVIPAEMPDAEGAGSFTRGGAGAYFASNNHEFGGTVRVEGASGDMGWRLHGIGRKAEALHTPDCELENTGFSAVNGEGAVSVHGTRGNATLRVARYGGEFHLLEAKDGMAMCIVEGQGSMEPAGEEGPVRKSDDERVQFTGNYVTTPALRIETKAQWQRHSLIEVSDEAGVPAPPGGEPTAFDLLLNTLTLDVLGHTTVGEIVRGTIGVSGLTQTNDTRGPIPFVPDASTQSVSGFVFEQATHGTVSILAGARFDHRKTSSDEIIADDGTLVPADSERTWNVATGDIGLVVQPVPHVSLAANAGRAWRAPTLFELFANGPHLAESRFEIGDPDLQEETSLNLDGSVRWQCTRVRGEVSAYRNSVNDFLFVTPTPDSMDALGERLQIFRHTQADALLRGVEAAASVEALPALSLGATYDLVRGTFRESDENLPLMPAPRVRGEAEVHTPRAMTWAERAFFGAEVERVFEQTHLATVDDAHGAEAHTLVHLRAGIDRRIGGRVWRLDVRARNVGNTHYRDFLSRYKAFADSPGRDVIARVSTAF